VSEREVMRSILIVDDSEAIRMTLEAIFEDRGFDVIGVGTLAEARTRLSRRFDVVLLDLHLPDGSGSSLARELQAGHPTSSVILMTGDLDADPVGADMVALKGGDPDELAVLVDRLIARNSPRADSR
jgi:DNA-binding response OmpR family regulator